MTTTTAEPVTLRIRGPLLVLATYALTTLLSILLHVGEIVFTNHDAHASDGPIASIVDTAAVGTPALLIALAIAIPLHRDPARARVGAIVLGVLMIVSLPVFWSGASACSEPRPHGSAVSPGTPTPRPEPHADSQSPAWSWWCCRSCSPWSAEPRPPSSPDDPHQPAPRSPGTQDRPA